MTQRREAARRAVADESSVDVLRRVALSEAGDVRQRRAIASTSSKRSSSSPVASHAAGEERLAGGRRQRDRVLGAAGGHVMRSRSTLDLGLRSRARHLHAVRRRASARRHARQAERHRVAEEDLRERLADDRRMPQRRIACGACSRDEPQPKLRVDDEDRRAADSADRRTDAARPRRLRLRAIVFEQVLLEALERDRLAESAPG